MAATTMSARRTLSGRSFVRLWQVVTVASAFCSKAATGTPTMLLRPTTTASFPAMEMPERTSSSMQPAGVHGMNCGVRPFITSWPMFIGWNPSTSLFRLIRSSTACSFSPFGSGSCTRMPLTAGSALSARTKSSTSAWVAVAGSRWVMEPIPASSHALPLAPT